MENEQRGHSAETLDHRALAVALLDISADVRRKSHEDTGVRPLPNGAVDILRVVEGSPGITVAEVAARLGRQFSNVSVQLRELVAANLVTRMKDPSDKRYVTLHPTEESQRIRAILENSWAGVLAASASKLLPGEQQQLAASLPALQRLAGFLAEKE